MMDKVTEEWMTESADLAWFEKTECKCRCGKRATGLLRSYRNENYGPHCEKCAERRIRDSKKRRAALSKEKG